MGRAWNPVIRAGMLGEICVIHQIHTRTGKKKQKKGRGAFNLSFSSSHYQTLGPRTAPWEGEVFSSGQANLTHRFISPSSPTLPKVRAWHFELPTPSLRLLLFLASFFAASTTSSCLSPSSPSSPEVPHGTPSPPQLLYTLLSLTW